MCYQVGSRGTGRCAMPQRHPPMPADLREAVPDCGQAPVELEHRTWMNDGPAQFASYGLARSGLSRSTRETT